MAAEPHAYVVERVKEALATDPRVSELHLDVTLVGEKVFVAGTVPTEPRRSAALDVVREAAPDLTVVSQVTVEGLDGEPSVEELP